MFNSTYIELSQTALANNISFLRKQLKGNARLSFVAKGNAYGHGIKPIVSMAEKAGVDHFSVYSAEEAEQVYAASKAHPTVLVMGYLSDAAVEWAIEKGVEFFVFEFKRLEKAVQIAKRLNIPAKIHLELETGMNRTGFQVEELPQVVEFVKKNAGYIELVGCCTHFAGAESISNYLRIQKQKRAFKKYLKYLQQQDLQFEQIHACCSAAAFRYPDMHFDLVRFGIMNYGYWPSEEIFIEYSSKKKKLGQDPLKRVISWKSSVMSLKKVEKGDFIGYGTSYQASENIEIALVPVGYGYGYSRNLSNTGRVLINGKRAGVIGIVNMNCIAVNINNLETVKIGDEVTLIGGEGDQQISVASFSKFSDQLNYELLTRLPHNIPRLIK
ncbi:alanine racemase [Luteibaculum oceani]|uniref:Alanine racemase n=1 Tax=Luteibaculum oceani TaxID=1294296 RepID=A0A5C6UV44_9FLAO|nr:alanine racemase [Luteibaculum oceani]TXC76111.1 alanine racemase [Luteibaculum oceani]